MTKRYNMFNYPETYIGIFLCLVPALILFFLFTMFHNYPDSSLVLIISISLVSVLICVFSIIPQGIKYIRQGMNRAYNCDQGYLYGRVKSSESNIKYMIHELDSIKAFEYCATKGCSRCPFRSSCRSTGQTWLFYNIRLRFRNMPQCDEIVRFSRLIDRYDKCDKDKCSLGCSYASDCLETHFEDLSKQIYCFLKDRGYYKEKR